ncbi:high mobility group B protein 3-like [Cornus florida]|uniref:high mobility group B protein 3-like n=1 Tax=Cornus florida TaxID=4283 RepID=UPI00289FA50C|nr:high mobility group B protein 3-like [Cornus florida]
MKGRKSKTESKKSDSKLSVKTRPTKSSKGKAAVDPNKPKRPATAFFVFMEEFRKQFKEKNPNNKSVPVVGKAGGAKWKSMSDAEKAPHVSKANKRKKDYEKNMDAYNKKLAQGTNASEDENEESDKSRSEANDEDDERSEGSGEVEDSE